MGLGGLDIPGFDLVDIPSYMSKGLKMAFEDPFNDPLNFPENSNFKKGSDKVPPPSYSEGLGNGETSWEHLDPKSIPGPKKGHNKYNPDVHSGGDLPKEYFVEIEKMIGTNKFGLSDKVAGGLTKIAEDGFDKIMEAMRDRFRGKDTTEEKLREEAGQKTVAQIRDMLNILQEEAVAKGKAPSDAKVLIDHLTMQRRLAHKRMELTDVDTMANYRRGREKRQMRQEIAQARMAQGNAYTSARLANQQANKTRAVMINRTLRHIPAKGTATIFPMNSVSFDMSVGNP